MWFTTILKLYSYKPDCSTSFKPNRKHSRHCSVSFPARTAKEDVMISSSSSKGRILLLKSSQKVLYT